MSEYTGHVIRKISSQGNFITNYELITIPTGQVTTIAGKKCGFADGQGRNASFNYPWSISFSQLHNCLYISDSGNHRIRTLDLQTGIF